MLYEVITAKAEIPGGVLRGQAKKLSVPAEALPVGFDDLPIPAARILNGPFLRSVIHVHEAEPLGVALGPLKVVQEAPVEIRGDVRPVVNGLFQLQEVPSYNFV